MQARMGTGGNQVPVIAYGFDSYNQTIIQEVAQTLRSHQGDTTPKVIVRRQQEVAHDIEDSNQLQGTSR